VASRLCHVPQQNNFSTQNNFSQNDFSQNNFSTQNTFLTDDWSCSCSVPTPIPIHLLQKYTRPHGRRHNQSLSTHMQLAPTFHTLYNNLFTTQQTIKASRRTNLSRHLFPLPITTICHHIHTILFCVTQPASIPSNTPSPPNALTLVPPRTSSKCSKNRNHNAGTRHDSPIPVSPTHNTYSLFLVSQPRRSPHIRIPLTIRTTLFSATQLRSPHIHPPQSKYIQPHSRVPTGVDLPTYTSPHSQYIQPLFRVLPGVDLLTYILPFLFSLPTNTVRGREICGVVCYLSPMLSLAGGHCQTRFVRAMPTDVVSYL